MKIAFITRLFPQDSFGGGQFYSYEMWKRLKRDHEVHLISGWENDPKLLPKGTYVIDQRRRSRIANYKRMRKGVKKYLNEIKPDVVVSTTLEIPVKYKTVFTIYHIGHWSGYYKDLFSRIQRFFAKRKLKQAEKLIAISKATINDLKKIGIKKDVSLVYPGLDFKKLKVKKVKNKKFTIVYPSRISREKGQDVLIKAVRNMDNVRVIIVGYVNDPGYLKELKMMSKNVEFKTNVPDIVKYYQMADLIVFPTLVPEGFGFTAAEAMACGKAVVASDFPAVREVVGKSGIIVKPGDYLEMRDAILKLKNDNKLREKMGKEGAKSVRERFDWDKSYRIYKKVLESVK